MANRFQKKNQNHLLFQWKNFLEVILSFIQQQRMKMMSFMINTINKSRFRYHFQNRFQKIKKQIIILIGFYQSKTLLPIIYVHKMKQNQFSPTIIFPLNQNKLLIINNQYSFKIKMYDPFPYQFYIIDFLMNIQDNLNREFFEVNKQENEKQFGESFIILTGDINLKVRNYCNNEIKLITQNELEKDNNIQRKEPAFQNDNFNQISQSQNFHSELVEIHSSSSLDKNPVEAQKFQQTYQSNLNSNIITKQNYDINQIGIPTLPPQKNTNQNILNQEGNLGLNCQKSQKKDDKKIIEIKIDSDSESIDDRNLNVRCSSVIVSNQNKNVSSDLKDTQIQSNQINFNMINNSQEMLQQSLQKVFGNYAIEYFLRDKLYRQWVERQYNKNNPSFTNKRLIITIPKSNQIHSNKERKKLFFKQQISEKIRNGINIGSNLFEQKEQTVDQKINYPFTQDNINMYENVTLHSKAFPVPPTPTLHLHLQQQVPQFHLKNSQNIDKNQPIQIPTSTQKNSKPFQIINDSKKLKKQKKNNHKRIGESLCPKPQYTLENINKSRHVPQQNYDFITHEVIDIQSNSVQEYNHQIEAELKNENQKGKKSQKQQQIPNKQDLVVVDSEEEFSEENANNLIQSEKNMNKYRNLSFNPDLKRFDQEICASYQQNMPNFNSYPQHISGISPFAGNIQSGSYVDMQDNRGRMDLNQPNSGIILQPPYNQYQQSAHHQSSYNSYFQVYQYPFF